MSRRDTRARHMAARCAVGWTRLSDATTRDWVFRLRHSVHGARLILACHAGDPLALRQAQGHRAEREAVRAHLRDVVPLPVTWRDYVAAKRAARADHARARATGGQGVCRVCACGYHTATGRTPRCEALRALYAALTGTGGGR